MHRELDAKLLLSCFAAERGFSVITGFKRDIHHSLEKLPASLYLGKALYATTLGLYQRLHALGYSVLSTDEEALVYYSPETYRTAKIGRETLRETDLLFAWGEENAALWHGYEHYDGTPIHVTGNPRIDMLRPEMRDYWQPDVDALRQRFGDYILINSNFGKVNHYREDRSSQLHILDAAGQDPASVDEYEHALAAHRLELFNAFKAMAATVARTWPDRTLVIRPHPSERHETWREATAGCDNVEVVYEGNVIPWLLAAGVVVHNGCTTGLEAWLLDRPVVAYEPVSSERFDLYLPNGVSMPAADVDSLLELIATALAGDLANAADDRASELVRRHITALDGELAAARIVDVLAQLQAPPGEYAEPSRMQHLGMRGKGAITRARLWLKPRVKGMWNPEKRRRYSFHEHKFAELPPSELESRIARFSELLGRFHNVQVNRLDKKIYELRNASG